MPAVRRLVGLWKGSQTSPTTEFLASHARWRPFHPSHCQSCLGPLQRRCLLNRRQLPTAPAMSVSKKALSFIQSCRGGSVSQLQSAMPFRLPGSTPLQCRAFLLGPRVGDLDPSVTRASGTGVDSLGDVTWRIIKAPWRTPGLKSDPVVPRGSLVANQS